MKRRYAGRWWCERHTGFVRMRRDYGFDVRHLFQLPCVAIKPILELPWRTINRNDDRQLWIAILQIHNITLKGCVCVIYNAYN